MQAAIYQFTNKISGKIYIGQSVDIISRFSQHIRHTHNKYLFSDINEYGIESFKFEVLEFIPNDINELKSFLNEREQFYIDQYIDIKVNNESVLYNIGETISGLNRIVSQTVREKQSIAKTNSKLSIEHKAKISKTSKERFPGCPFSKCDKSTVEYRKKVSVGLRKKFPDVLQYSLEGKYIARFETQTDASISIGIKSAYNINKCLKNITKQAYGYQWKYYTENFPLEINNIIKRVRVLDYNKNEVGIFDSPILAAEFVGTYPNRVYAALNNNKHNYSAEHYFYYID